MSTRLRRAGFADPDFLVLAMLSLAVAAAIAWVLLRPLAVPIGVSAVAGIACGIISFCVLTVLVFRTR